MKLNTIILVISLCCFICLALANDQNELQSSSNKNDGSIEKKLPKVKIFSFERFKSMFKKSYKSLVEELVRKKIFLSNTFKAFLSVTGYNHYERTYYLGVNDKSDWTKDELKTLEGRETNAPKEINLHDNPTDTAKSAGSDNNDYDDEQDEQESKSRHSLSNFIHNKIRTHISNKVYVDHRDYNCLTGVKNQKKCGSCYVFSTTSLYEWRYCKETGKLVSFSEQFAIDCGNPLIKCGKGHERNVGKFFYSNGIELSKNYPYKATQNTCPYDKSINQPKMGYLRVKEPGLRVISYSEFDEYLSRMPIIVGIGVSDSFHSYAYGVDDGKDCDNNRGHSVLIVGSGKEDGVKY